MKQAAALGGQVTTLGGIEGCLGGERIGEMRKRVGSYPLVSFAVALVLGLGLGVAGSVAAQASRYGAQFEDGFREFCSDGGSVNISVLELRSDFEGFESHAVAAGTLVDWIRANAVPENADPRFVHILEQAMAPARDFVLPVASVVDPDLIHYDLDQESDGILEARAVVDRLPNGGFAVSTYYICSGVLSDPNIDIAEYWKGVGA